MEKHNLISYKILGGYAYGVLSKCADTLDTLVEFDPKINGRLLIGRYTFDISDGKAKPDMRTLNDGDHNVSVHTEDGVIRADKIMRSGRRISLSSKGEKELLALRKDLLCLKEELSSIRLELAEIRKRIDGSSVL